jgi:RNA recognition motif. (a.k.a. RRM, RBD, or RNP domain)
MWPAVLPQSVQTRCIQMGTTTNLQMSCRSVMPDGGGAGDKPRTLWIGDLGYWMDETFLYNLFAATGTVTSVKIIRSKTTNVSEGYGFIEFTSHEAAAQVRLASRLLCLNAD